MSPNAEKSRKVEKVEKEEEKKKKNAIEKEIEKIDDPNQNGETQSTTPKKVLFFVNIYTFIFSQTTDGPDFSIDILSCSLQSFQCRLLP